MQNGIQSRRLAVGLPSLSACNSKLSSGRQRCEFWLWKFSWFGLLSRCWRAWQWAPLSGRPIAYARMNFCRHCSRIWQTCRHPVKQIAPPGRAGIRVSGEAAYSGFTPVFRSSESNNSEVVLKSGFPARTICPFAVLNGSSWGIRSNQRWWESFS